MLLPTPLFPGCKKREPVTVAIRTINGKKGPDVNLNAGDIPVAPGSESSVQDEIKGIHGILGSTGSFKKIEDYLYEADCPLPNAELAEEHFRARFGKDASQGAADFIACSVLNHDGLIGRAYDWKYDEAVTFVVHTPANGDRFASVSICSSPAGITKESVEAHTVPAALWAVLPFYAVDGMNENGVTCSVCVVHGKGSEDILWHGKEFCAVGAVRHVLDRARTAEEGADIIASEAWMPASAKLGGYSLHFMVTDETHTFIVEDGVVIDITEDDTKVMTNFRLGSRSFLDETGHADVDKIASYDPYGTGVERYNELVDYAKFTSEETGMREWLTGFVYSDAYRESLLTRSTTRPSEFAGTEISQDRFVKINETEAIKAWFKSAKVHEKWVARERDGKFWQTVHSAVYDVASRAVSVVVQEGTAVHYFSIARDGGSGTVKSVNDVEPDSKTGNVALTAQDIPYSGEGASNVETAIEQNAQAIGENTNAIDAVEQQLGELKDDTYTKSEVDDKINQSAAHYLTKRTGTVGHYTYPQFETHADLAAAKAAHTKENPQFFYGTEGHTPDKNDYCIVLADEEHKTEAGVAPTTRYMFVGSWNDNGYFRYQYTINETPLSQAQWDALDSGITAEILAQLARKSDIPITTADIEDYENYRGHFDLDALYMKDDIVRAVKASTGEVAYFKSLVGNNRGVNPFTEGQNRWERTEDDEGLDKLSKFVKAAIAGMTGADISVSPTDARKIADALLAKSTCVKPANPSWYDEIALSTNQKYTRYGARGATADLYKGPVTFVRIKCTFAARASGCCQLRGYKPDGSSDLLGVSKATNLPTTAGASGLEVTFEFDPPVTINPSDYQILGVQFRNETDTANLGIQLLALGQTVSGYSMMRSNGGWGDNAPAISFGCVVPYFDTSDTGIVVELDEATKRLYVMKRGVRTTEEITSWATLFDLTKRGLVRLYYLASGSGDTGRKALYTAHMVDDNPNRDPAILFDATGFIGTNTIYSRTITLTKEGTNGIHVAVGALTEIAKDADKPDRDVVIVPNIYTPSQLNTWVEYSPVLEIDTNDTRVQKWRVNGVNKIVLGSRTSDVLATGQNPIVLTDAQKKTEIRAWVGIGTRSSVTWVGKSINTQTVEVNGKDYEFYFEDKLNLASVTNGIYIAFFGKDVTTPSGITNGTSLLLACVSANTGYHFYDKHQASPNWVNWAAPYLSFVKSDLEVEKKIDNAIAKIHTGSDVTITDTTDAAATTAKKITAGGASAVIPAVDTTLSKSGQAADAHETGVKLAGKVDASEIRLKSILDGVVLIGEYNGDYGISLYNDAMGLSGLYFGKDWKLYLKPDPYSAYRIIVPTSPVYQEETLALVSDIATHEAGGLTASAKLALLSSPSFISKVQEIVNGVFDNADTTSYGGQN